MRSAFVKSLVVSALLLFVAGSAQASVSRVLTVKVPFPFLVNGKTYPAGQYAVEADDAIPEVLYLRGMHSPDGTFLSTVPGSDQSPGAPVLRFKRDETQYRLADIQESNGMGLQVLKHW